MNASTWKQRGIRALINLAVGVAFAAVVAMLFDALVNALPGAVHAMFQALLRPKQPQKFWFRPSFFFQPPKGVSRWLMFALAFAFTAIYSRRVVFRISQKIQSHLPCLRSTVEGSQRWATKREIRRSLIAIPKEHAKPAPLSVLIQRIAQKARGLVPYPHSPDEGTERQHEAEQDIRNNPAAEPKEHAEPKQHPGLLLASDRRHYYVEGDVVHSLVVGITGSGKDQLLVLPSIHLISQSERPENLVAFDLKGDMLKSSYADLQKKGYRIFVLNFKEPAFSHQWNPLSAQIIPAYIEEAEQGGADFSRAVELTNELAQIITENPKSDPVWPQSAKSLLTAIILFLLEDGYKKKCLDKLNLYSVYNFFVELGGREIKRGEHTYNALDCLMSSLPIGHPAKMAYATSKFAVGEMRSSIFATLASNLQMFGDSGVAFMTGGHEIDFNALVDEERPCAVFMVMDENKVTRYMLATLFISQCYSALVELAEKRPNRDLPRRVHFYMNEFGSTPRIPDMQQKFAAARSLGIVLNLFIQDLPQLEDKYGRHAASTIQGNCGNWVYLNSTDKDTNQYFSDMLSNETLVYSTYNAENGDILDRTKMTHQKARALKTKDELWRIPKGDVIVMRQRQYPIYTHLPYYYKLGLPVTQIADIMPKRKIRLGELLYPVDGIGVPGMPDITPQEAQAAEERGQKMLVQASINNLNILTGMAFGRALDSMDLTQARAIIQKYLNEGNIDQKQVNALEAHLNSLQ